MSNQSKRRCWYQFSLKGMLGGITLASLALAWLAYERSEVRKREAAVQAIQDLGGGIVYDEGVLFRPTWLRPVLGDHSAGEVVTVYFYGHQVPDAGLAHLAGLTKLRTLNLNGSQVTDAGLAHLSRLTELEELELQRTQVTDAGLLRLARLPKLKELWLGGQVTDAGLVHLKMMPQLEYLDLKGNQFTDAGLVHLAVLPELKTLWLKETQVTDQGVNALQKALPNLQIVR